MPPDRTAPGPPRIVVWWVTAVAVGVPLALVTVGFAMGIGVLMSDGLIPQGTYTNPVTKYVGPLFTAAAVTGIVLPGIGLAVSVRARQTLPFLLNAGTVWLTSALVVKFLFTPRG